MSLQGWTQDRVLGLAPDPASASAGRGLAHPKKWVSLGHDDSVAWGECQGSGSKPYQVRFDLAAGASKCSCPSRKFPCKHVLGLMLIAASAPDAVARADRPAWVEEWLASRTDRAEKAKAKAEAPPKPVDKVAQAKRREARLSRVSEGLAAVRTWFEDLLRTGLAGVPGRGYEFFDEPARRMVDAQAPGVARRIRALGEIAASGAHWQRPFLEELASIHLLARAVERIDTLPPATRHDVLATLGVPVQADDDEPPQAVGDTWQMIAQERGVEERVRFQRTWLFGRTSRRPALVLDFAHATQPLPTTLPAGVEFEGELAFFPGTPVRATVRTPGPIRPIRAIEGFPTLAAACAAAGEMMAQQPWLDEVVVPLNGVIPVRTANQWSVVDAEHRALPASMGESAGWTALAVSGGNPVDVMAAYDGRRVRPLSLIAGGEYIPLIAVEEGAAA